MQDIARDTFAYRNAMVRLALKEALASALGLNSIAAQAMAQMAALEAEMDAWDAEARCIVCRHTPSPPEPGHIHIDEVL